MTPIYLYGQSSSDNNNTGTLKYLGYDGAQDLDFKTNNILRMQLMETQSNTINGWPGIVQSGHLGLSDELGLFSGIRSLSTSRPLRLHCAPCG